MRLIMRYIDWLAFAIPRSILIRGMVIGLLMVLFGILSLK